MTSAVAQAQAPKYFFRIGPSMIQPAGSDGIGRRLRTFRTFEVWLRTAYSFFVRAAESNAVGGARVSRWIAMSTFFRPEAADETPLGRTVQLQPPATVAQPWVYVHPSLQATCKSAASRTGARVADMREREENCVASTSRDDPAGARNCAPRKIWSDAPPRPHRPAKATLADRIEEKLDRRDKDILRYLEAHRGRYVSCRELLSLNYGIFDAGMSIEELILKIFKIRRFLNARLGLDPISFDSEFRFVFTDMAKEECAKLMGAIAI